MYRFKCGILASFYVEFFIYHLTEIINSMMAIQVVMKTTKSVKAVKRSVSYVSVNYVRSQKVYNFIPVNQA